MDEAAFRDAMTLFASGVTIPVTADAAGRYWGMTASAFCSLSLTPPQVLVCIATSADSYPAFAHAERFAIHVLGEGQKELAMHFARKHPDKFETLDYKIAEDGLPAFADVLARVSCTADAVHEGGDHVILVGRVESAEVSSGRPLLHFARTLWSPDELGLTGSAAD